MIESSSLVRDQTAENNMMTFGTPSKSSTRNSILVGNEENQENIMNSPCDTKTMTNKVVTNEAPSSSSVSARREWLKNFGKMHADRHRSPIKENNSSTTTPKKTTVGGSAAAVKTPGSASRVAMRLQAQASSTGTNHLADKPVVAEQPVTTVKRNFTPQKKKRVNTGGAIEATDETQASVAKLSQWLANDPTSQKKVGRVRKGRNVSYKSRVFEKGQLNAIARDNHIQKGSVSDRQKWLKNTFHLAEEKEEPKNELTSRLHAQYAKSEGGAPVTRYPRSSMCVPAKKDWLKNAFKTAADASREENQPEEARSVIITNDAASSLSVSDKKSWLQNAFKHTEDAGSTPGKKMRTSRNYSKATSDIMHCRGESRDEIAARAKRRFLQRSARGTPGKSPVRGTPGRGGNTPSKMITVSNDMNNGNSCPPAANHPIQSLTSMNEEVQTKGSIVEPCDHRVEEDTTPVDFRAARDLLVQRGRQNGNKMEVMNKVYFKKSKFEEIERERKQKTEDIALKRPFDEMLGGLP